MKNVSRTYCDSNPKHHASQVEIASPGRGAIKIPERAAFLPAQDRAGVAEEIASKAESLRTAATMMEIAFTMADCARHWPADRVQMAKENIYLLRSQAAVMEAIAKELKTRDFSTIAKLN